MDRQVKSESSKNVFEILRQKKIAAALAVGVGIAALAGCAPTSEAKPGTSQSQSPSPEATSPEVVETQKPSGELDVTQIPENVIEYNLFDSLSPEQQSQIQEMANEDLATFRQRDISEQLAFGQFVYDNNIDVLKYRLDATDQTALYEGANLDTPEGIVKSNSMKMLLLSSLKTDSETEGIGLDKDTALKASVILQNQGDSVGVQNLDDIINSWSVNTPPTGVNYKVEDSVKLTGENVVYAGNSLEKGGEVINYRNPETSMLYQTIFTPVEFKKITGEDATTMVRFLTFDQNDPRFNQDLHS